MGDPARVCAASYECVLVAGRETRPALMLHETQVVGKIHDLNSAKIENESERQSRGAESERRQYEISGQDR